MTARNSVYTRLRVLTAAAVTAGALVLLGCAGGAPGGGGSPSTPAPSPSTSSATPTPTPSAAYKPADAKGKAQNVPVPVMPEAAKAETKEGLEAFAKYWYASLSYAFESGDIKSVAAVTSESCSTCNKQISVLSDWYQAGGWVQGGKFDVDVAQSNFQAAAPHEYQVVIQLRQLEGTFFKADGSMGNSQSTTDFFGDIMVASFDEGHWTAKTVERVGGQG